MEVDPHRRRRLPAERAHQFGLVNQLVEPGEALDGGVALAEQICANAPLAVRESRKVVLAAGRRDRRDGWKMSLRGHLEPRSAPRTSPKGPAPSSRSAPRSGRAASAPQRRPLRRPRARAGREGRQVIVSMMPWSGRNSARPSTRSESATSRQRHPRGLRGVVTGDGFGAVEHRDPKVEDHEVVVVPDALDPADELATHAFEPGLLGQLADDGLDEHLAPSTRPPGSDHSPAAGPLPGGSAAGRRRRARRPRRHTPRLHAAPRSRRMIDGPTTAGSLGRRARTSRRSSSWHRCGPATPARSTPLHSRSARQRAPRPSWLRPTPTPSRFGWT